MIKYIAIAVFSVLLSCLSQVLLKISAGRQWPAKLREYLNIFVISGYCLLGVCVLLGVYVMTGLDMKYSAVIESLGYVFMLLLSRLIFKERITRAKLIGNAMIVAGIIVFNINL